MDEYEKLSELEQMFQAKRKIDQRIFDLLAAQVKGLETPAKPETWPPPWTPPEERTQPTTHCDYPHTTMVGLRCVRKPSHLGQHYAERHWPHPAQSSSPPPVTETDGSDPMAAVSPTTTVSSSDADEYRRGWEDATYHVTGEALQMASTTPSTPPSPQLGQLITQPGLVAHASWCARPDLWPTIVAGQDYKLECPVCLASSWCVKILAQAAGIISSTSVRPVMSTPADQTPDRVESGSGPSSDSWPGGLVDAGHPTDTKTGNCPECYTTGYEAAEAELGAEVERLKAENDRFRTAGQNLCVALGDMAREQQWKSVEPYSGSVLAGNVQISNQPYAEVAGFHLNANGHIAYEVARWCAESLVWRLNHLEAEVALGHVGGEACSIRLCGVIAREALAASAARPGADTSPAADNTGGEHSP